MFFKFTIKIKDLEVSLIDTQEVINSILKNDGAYIVKQEKLSDTL